MSAEREPLDALIERRGRQMLEDEEGDWITGARIAEISARVRKTMAETPPDADTVTAATSKAAALMEAVLTGRATGAE